MPALEPLPLPSDPTLAAYAAVLNESGHVARVLDAQWRVVFDTDEFRLWHGEDSAELLRHLGCHLFGPEPVSYRAALWARDSLETEREWFQELGRFILFDTPGGREGLRPVVDPALRDLVDLIEPVEPPPLWIGPGAENVLIAGTATGLKTLYLRVRDHAGTLVGTIRLTKPRAGMSHLMNLAGAANLGHLDRMALVERPDRRPTAVLMADLEASSPLARRLSTAQYFAFGRRLVRTADQCIVDHGGIVGRHAGDGVVAFFLTETAGSESAAARACIETARALQTAVADITQRSGIDDANVALRFGLHWGSTLYVGRITTAGRTEVTALGDEANEAARIEACATGGRTIASKALIERLTTPDAHALGIDPDRTTYTPLGDLPTATDKARRDAPAIAVCDLTT